MKKILVGVLFISVLIFPLKTSALMNSANVEISDKYYDSLIKKYGEEYVDYMSQETYNNITLKNYELEKSEVHYYKTVEYADEMGNIIKTEEIEISKEEYDSINPEISAHAKCTPPGIGNEIYYDCWETDSKKIYMNVFHNGNYLDPYYITLTNAWKTQPKVKSYDNIGMRGVGAIFQGSGAQVIWYASNGQSVVLDYSNPKQASNGRGYTVSLPIDNNPQYPIVIGMHQYVAPANLYETMSIYGAYSHAKESVTLSQVTNYSFSDYKGGVFLYGGSITSTINNRFDSMQGVKWIKSA